MRRTVNGHLNILILISHLGFNTIPLNPTSISSLCNRDEWLALSKAVLRSENTSTVLLSSSAPVLYHLWLLSQFQCCVPDNSFTSIYSVCCMSLSMTSWAAIFSTTLDKNGMLETGVLLLCSCGSRLGLFSNGPMTATLNWSSKSPEGRDTIIMPVIGLARTHRDSLISWLGIEYSGQVVSFVLVISVFNFCSLTKSNMLKDCAHC